MTYIIIDTNAWIYLCNAYGLTKDTTGEFPHIKMFNELKDMVLKHDITILSNDIILAEWNRNKGHSRDLIERFQRQRQERSNRLKKKIMCNQPDDVTAISAEIRQLDILIKKNERHITDVEDLLLNHTVKYDITDDSKIMSADQAIARKAPFNGKKSNSMADMVILLSGVKYIAQYCVDFEDEDIGIKEYAENYFVSANKADFSSKEDEKAIHGDIEPYLIDTNTQYYCNLGVLINELSGSSVLNDDDLQNYDTYSSDFIPCPLCPDDHLGSIHYTDPIKIRDEKYSLHNPEQMRFSFDTTLLTELNRDAYVEIQEGQCVGCCSNFIKCACCEEPILIDYYSTEDEFECNTCNAVYRIRVKFGRKGDFESVNYTLLAKNGDDE